MRFAVPAASAAVAAVLALPAASGHPAHAASPGYKVVAGTFTATHLGPAADKSCDIKYDLYTPDPAPADGTAPAILTTNGFGGSKADGASLGRWFAAQGYVVLSYSGLGFGGSDCTIELDSPEWDGRAASEIIDYLGTLPMVMKDGPDDPRVGMIGGSYGGAIQLSTASVTPKLDTIIPEITWNDLAYSLTPNNDSAALQWTDAVPGAPKAEWTNLFFGEGLSEPFQNHSTQDHSTIVSSTIHGCPGFDAQVCEDQLTAIAKGAANKQTVAFLRHASMVRYGSRVRIPTMLMQGEGDTLFDIDEAVANRDMIMANGAYVKLVLQSWGHSFSGDPTDNADFSDPANPTYEDELVQHWFDHYLKGSNVGTGPAVEYFRDWLYNPAASAAPAYGAADSWPIAPASQFGLSGASDLVALAGGQAVAAGSQTFASVPGPGSYSETSALQYSGTPLSSVPASDPPGTFASWTTPALAQDTAIAGIPTLTFHVSAAVPAVPNDPPSMPVLFGKLYDVAPDGTTSLLFPRLVSPIRIADPSKPVTMTLPGVVHLFPRGHAIRLVLATSDDAYLNSRTPNVITVSSSPQQPSILSLPVLGAAATQATLQAQGVGAPLAVAASAAGGLANTSSGAPSALVPMTLVLAGGALVALRRRRGRTLG